METAGRLRMGRTLEELDQAICDAIVARNVQLYKQLVAEKTELLLGIGPFNFSAIMSVFFKTQPARAAPAAWQPSVYRESVYV
jgi:hypothetical protein